MLPKKAIRISLKLKADTVALLQRLAQRHVPLYCLSNMSAARRGRIIVDNYASDARYMCIYTLSNNVHLE
jgi:hypothetical protein